MQAPVPVAPAAQAAPVPARQPIVDEYSDLDLDLPILSYKKKLAHMSSVQRMKTLIKQAEYDRHEIHHRVFAPHHENERKSMESGRKWGARSGMAGGALGAGGAVSWAGRRENMLRLMDGKKKIPKKLIAGAALTAGILGSQVGGLAGRGVGGSMGRTFGVARGPGKEKRSSIADNANSLLRLGNPMTKAKAALPSMKGFRSIAGSNPAPTGMPKITAKPGSGW